MSLSEIDYTVNYFESIFKAEIEDIYLDAFMHNPI